MLTIIRKILPILILGVLFNFSVSNIPLFKANDALFDLQSAYATQTTQTTESNRDISSESATPSNLKLSNEQDTAEQRWRMLEREFEWEVYEILVGIFLVFIGLAAILLALFRWNPNDLSLLSFGIFCFLFVALPLAI